MSFPETPVMTDVERLIEAQAQTQAKLEELTTAVNGLGVNVQWVIDNAKGIFEMFSNPAFLSQMGGMFNASE